MRPDVVPGAVFPDYELSDHRGKHRTLSELQGADPLVLVLSRGGFCGSLARVRRAQRLLETTELAIEQVAAEAGFGSAAVMREHFGTVVDTSPLSYRRAFSRVDRPA